MWLRQSPNQLFDDKIYITSCRHKFANGEIDFAFPIGELCNNYFFTGAGAGVTFSGPGAGTGAGVTFSGAGAGAGTGGPGRLTFLCFGFLCLGFSGTGFGGGGFSIPGFIGAIFSGAGFSGAGGCCANVSVINTALIKSTNTNIITFFMGLLLADYI